MFEELQAIEEADDESDETYSDLIADIELPGIAKLIFVFVKTQCVCQL